MIQNAARHSVLILVGEKLLIHSFVVLVCPCSSRRIKSEVLIGDQDVVLLDFAKVVCRLV